jgi:hypothetical protein
LYLIIIIIIYLLLISEDQQDDCFCMGDMATLSGAEETDGLICIRNKFLHNLYLKTFDESKECHKEGRFWSYRAYIDYIK